SASTFKTDFTAKSDAHKTCRQTEKLNFNEHKTCDKDHETAKATQTTSCDAVAAMEKTMYEYKSTCEVQAGETFEAFHTRIIKASQKHLADYKTAKSACEDAKKAVEEKETECTTALKTYESQKTN
ncbi:unnamed protein product, partial [Symbiodinium pilosum]